MHRNATGRAPSQDARNPPGGIGRAETDLHS